uniref:Kelch like family member 4 n=1 Tax=Cavia porcellus TaxID=10141 RepID=H0VDF3_CAVPO
QEFEVKQILRLRWRWFSHSQGSLNIGSCLQQEGCEQRGILNHSQDRNGLKKGISSVHHSILASVPGQGTVHQARLQNLHQQNLIEYLPANENTPKAFFKEEESEEYFHAVNHAKQTLHKMENYLKEKQLCDVLLIAGHLQIPAHRLVLSAVSDYFAAMFTNDVVESNQEEVKMEGVDPDALNSLVQYAYTGMYWIYCCTYILNFLRADSVVGLLPYEHFIDVIKNQEFLQLPVNEISKFLCSDDINVPDEETIFYALMEWIGHDAQTRQGDLAMLLSYIRLPLLPRQMYNVNECQFKILIYMILSLFHIFLTGTTTIEKYDLRTNSWLHIGSMNGHRLQFGVAVIDNKLYIVGGRDGLKTLNTVECFNPVDKIWMVMPPMSMHRHGLGVVTLEGPMYAIGGHDGWSYLNTVERWDPEGHQWNYVASMSIPRSTLGVVALNNKLYAIGGRDGSSCLKSMEYFDPHTNKWNLCAPMSKRRAGVGVATYNGFLYVVGGHDVPASNHCSRFSDCVERYDPKNDSWSTLTPLSAPRDAVGMCPLGDKLYVVGGYDGHTYLNTVESFDAQKNEWNEEAPVNIGRAGACVVVLKLP